ncbi:MAG: GAF domain-containing protein [Actinobacteria bacterium]|nr:GAF domain-containing protein [Actinomycetota bacterium]
MGETPQIIVTDADRAKARDQVRAASRGTSVGGFVLVGFTNLIGAGVTELAFPQIDGVVRVRGFWGDFAEAVVLGIVAVALIGATIVRPFEHAMHARRRASADREASFRRETERRNFERQLATGLDLCDNEPDLLSTTAYAMRIVTGDAPTELLLAGDRDQAFERRLVTGREAPGCQVQDPARCPATRRGAVQVFADSESIDACPWLPDRPIGRVGCVCAPVSVTGRALGVLHAVHAVEEQPPSAQVEQLTALADHFGQHIGILRLTEAAGHGVPSELMARAAVGGAATNGSAEEGDTVLRAEAAG